MYKIIIDSAFTVNSTNMDVHFIKTSEIVEFNENRNIQIKYVYNKQENKGTIFDCLFKNGIYEGKYSESYDNEPYNGTVSYVLSKVDNKVIIYGEWFSANKEERGYDVFIGLAI
jgi:hypothetical protein